MTLQTESDAQWGHDSPFQCFYEVSAQGLKWGKENITGFNNKSPPNPTSF